MPRSASRSVAHSIVCTTAKSRVRVNNQKAILDVQHVDLLHEVASIVPETGVELDLVHLSSTGALDVTRMHNSNSSLARSWCACEASVMNNIVNKNTAANQEGFWIDQGDCPLGQIADRYTSCTHSH